MGRTYEPAKLYIFSDAVNSGCGNATSASGPFYCSADNTVYLDIEFFKNMKREIGADGDFAYAYVIAHEVGHHVQNQLGILGPVHQKRAQYGKDSPEANQLTVRLELQADFFAGVWASKDNQRFKSLEDGDIDEALDDRPSDPERQTQPSAQCTQYHLYVGCHHRPLHLFLLRQDYRHLRHFGCHRLQTRGMQHPTRQLTAGVTS